MRKFFIVLFFIFFVLTENNVFAFWVWTPGSKFPVNPKFAVKDDPGEQFEWAMRFFKQYDFLRAANEFSQLVKYYPDSAIAPEAQYYVGRSYEELGKYFFAFQNYQKVVEKYPYTKRMKEILKRQYNIANIFETKETSKLMDLELTVSLDRAVTIYEKIAENSPFGEYADKSLYKAAECYKRLKNYQKAMDIYERIIKDYPDSGLVLEAKYQLAYTKYEASLDPEYNQEKTDDAMKDFKQISETTSVPRVAEEAKKAVKELKDKRADSDFKIAEFYERQKKYESACMYYKSIVKEFPNTKAAEYAKEKIKELTKKI